MRRLLLTFATLAACAAWTGHAPAQSSQWYSSVYQGYSNNRMLSNHRAAISATMKSPTRKAPAAAAAKPLPISACQFEPATASPIMPAKLAHAFCPDDNATASGRTPAEARAVAEQTFTRLLDEYQAAMRKAGQEWDMARAVAAHIMLSYGAATGRDITFDQFKALAQQVRAIWAEDPKFRRQSAREKQEDYEFLVIMGQFVAVASEGAARQGNDAVLGDMRKMAEDNLRSLLGVTSQRLRFTNAGYEIVR